MKLPSSCEWTASYRSVRPAESRSGRAPHQGEPWPATDRCRRAGERAAGGTERGATPAGRRRPERIGNQVDGVPEIDECPDAVVFAERGAPGLEEGLRRDHEDFHVR